MHNLGKEYLIEIEKVISSSIRETKVQIGKYTTKNKVTYKDSYGRRLVVKHNPSIDPNIVWVFTYIGDDETLSRKVIDVEEIGKITKSWIDDIVATQEILRVINDLFAEEADYDIKVENKVVIVHHKPTNLNLIVQLDFIKVENKESIINNILRWILGNHTIV